jgi:hypothetical protein
LMPSPSSLPRNSPAPCLVTSLGALQTLARSLPTLRDALQSRTPFIRRPALRYPVSLEDFPRDLMAFPSDLQATVQRRVLDFLAQQIILDRLASSANMELRRLVQSTETLHQILQASGHTLLVGWETIFEVLGSVCWPTPSERGFFGRRGRGHIVLRIYCRGDKKLLKRGRRRARVRLSLHLSHVNE